MDKQEINNYCEEEDAKHFFTSAKTGEGLDEIFLYITKEIANQTQLNAVNKASNKQASKKLVISKDNNSKANNNNGCCK
jgi:Ras-related protein Rab-21